jgi:hypothetical protein
LSLPTHPRRDPKSFQTARYVIEIRRGDLSGAAPMPENAIVSVPTSIASVETFLSFVPREILIEVIADLKQARCI